VNTKRKYTYDTGGLSWKAEHKASDTKVLRQIEVSSGIREQNLRSVSEKRILLVFTDFLLIILTNYFIYRQLNGLSNIQKLLPVLALNVLGVFSCMALQDAVKRP